MHIIVKKSASHAMFRPHMNTSLNKFYYTKDDYMGDLKRMKLEPYRDIPERKSTPYTMDQSGREMVKQAAAYEKRRERPGSRFVKALNDLGIAKKPKWLSDAEALTNRGGFKDHGNQDDV